MLLYAHSARALSHYRDIVGVAAEGGDIVLYPKESRELIVKTVVSALSRLLLKLWQHRKAERPEAIVDSHADNALRGPHGLIKMLFVSASAGESAAVDIDDDGECTITFFGSKNVEEKPSTETVRSWSER